MDTRTTAWLRLRVLAAITVVALIGDLRAPVSAAAVPDGRSVRQQAPAQPRDAALQTIRSEGRDSDDTPGDEAADDARLVPAIYAWDPDVRFVYYRQVSKWM